MYIQLMKSLYKYYSMTFWLLIVYSIILVYPTIVNWANPAPPENQLHWISGKIVFAQQNHPNIRVEMSDGSTRDFDFYADLTGVFRGMPRFSGATNQELAKLQGSHAEIGVVPIRWLVLPHNQRIWEVRCESFSLPYAQLKNSYQRSLRGSFVINAVVYGFFILFTTIIFFAEKRKKWASQSSTMFQKAGDPEDLAGQAKSVSRLGWLLLTTWAVIFSLCLINSVKLATLIGSATGILVPVGLFWLWSARRLIRKASQNSPSSNASLADEEASSVRKDKWF